MDGLINQLRTLVEEQNALLLTNARVTGGNLRVNASSGGTVLELNGLEGDDPENAGEDTTTATTTRTTAADEALRVSVDQINGRLQNILPVVLLVLVKLLVDNFVAGAAVVLSLSSFYKLKQGFELELALKDRSSKSNLFGLFLFALVLLGVILFEIKRFDYTGSVWDRLSFQSLPNDRPYTLLETLWSCGITDMVVQLMILTVKIAVLNGVGVYTHFLSDEAHSPDDDLERGNHRNSLSATFSFSSLSSSLTGLVRRQVSSLSGGSTGHTHPAYSTVASGEAGLPVATPVGTGAGTVNSSDGSALGRENRAYLLKARLCSLVDVLGLAYRTALPITWWVAYLRSTAAVAAAVVLQILYVAVKLTDVSAKFNAAVVALSMFLGNKLEFGHYSTDEELRGREDAPGDCPVCFDNPHRPVTLDCQHVFCEVCILEWLEKETTCPVCRAQVQYSSPALRAIKAEANSAFPIIV